jgi:hypothetical protein
MRAAWRRRRTSGESHQWMADQAMVAVKLDHIREHFSRKVWM